MTFKASTASALILAAGLFVFSAGPSQAAVGADDAGASSKSATAAGVPALHKSLRHGWRHKRSYAHRRSHRLALKVVTETKAVTADAADGNESLSDLPPSVANANAQLRPPGTPGDDAKPAPPRPSGLAQDPPDAKSDNGIVAADQLNDVDRALQEGSNTPAALSAMASANPPPAPTSAARRESSLWEQTSLIGKIFIGCGALLTLASAARMFMA
jgi:hypothetical protein